MGWLGSPTFAGLTAAVALAATTAAHAKPPQPTRVRAFVVGHELRLEDAVSVESFRARMLALVDSSKRPAGLVQDGVDDVASHLAPRDPGAPADAVVHFPEDTGLVAGLIGSRGAKARGASVSIGAFADLIGSYAEVSGHYAGEFPELAALPLRAMVVSLTDVLYRSVYETFREIATTYGVYVSVSLNAAPARRIEASQDAALVELLRGPDEPERSYAYEATSGLPHNLVWLFAPDGEILVPDGGGGLLRSPSQTGGEIRASTWKSYLTPIEQTPEKPGGGLSLASGSVRDLEVLDTPVGAIGVVISKDAWMPDVNERLDAKGASFLLQSEAFSSWAFDDQEWDPDVFKEGGFGNLQRQAGFLWNVAPSMTGNLFEVTFDGQSAILEKRRDKRRPARRTAQNGWLGQPADTGFLAIAPWILPDPAAPGSADDGRSLAERRRSLVASGVKLLPDSGVPCADSLAWGACEAGYREWILVADLSLPTGPGRSGEPDGSDVVAQPIDRGTTPTTFGRSRAVSPRGGGRQRHPRIAADARTVAVVWDDTRDGPVPKVRLALSSDRGVSFSPPIEVSSSPAGERGELFPDVAIAGDRILVVWQAFDHGMDDDSGSIELATFDRRGHKVSGDVRVDDGERIAPAGRWQPAIAIADGGAPVVAWIDERDPGPDGVALAHLYAARGEPDGSRFAPAVRIDAGEPVPLAASHDNHWGPAVAARGRGVDRAGIGVRDYSWHLYAARSGDGGRSFGESLRLTGPSSSEVIAQGPAALVAGPGYVRAAVDAIRSRRPDSDLYLFESRDGGASFDERRVPDTTAAFDPDRDVPPSQSFPALADSGGRTFAVWQDDREGNADVLFGAWERAPGGPVTHVERVDDTGDGPSAQHRPRLAVSGQGSDTRCVVVWEDDREGRLRVYSAQRRCSTSRPPLR